MEVEQSGCERGPACASDQASAGDLRPKEGKATEGTKNGNHDSTTTPGRTTKKKTRRRSGHAESANGPRPRIDGGPEKEDMTLEVPTFAPLNLRQKLAAVRRRVAYIQKRGMNERFNYSYVKAADIAGAVGDILAELGVVVVPRLESIAYEPVRTGKTEAERAARVVMAYSFVDVNTGEEITVKTAGEGVDPGDKAPYKAMTGALKYALLQSFLLATGDDPEDERADSRAGAGPERVITPEQVRELQRLIEETGTELERVLAYYRISALDEMSESSYRRALELLNRKLARQSQENATHAQD